MADTKQLRSELKSELGYNARQVSIRARDCSVYFTIRDAEVSYAKVEQFASRAESISRCHVSGEILSGGNTFVNIAVTDEVKATWSAHLVGPIKAAYALLQLEKNPESTGVPVNDDLMIWGGQWPGDMDFHLTPREDSNSDRTPYAPPINECFAKAAYQAYLMIS